MHAHTLHRHKAPACVEDELHFEFERRGRVLLVFVKGEARGEGDPIEDQEHRLIVVIASLAIIVCLAACAAICHQPVGTP